MAKKRKKISIPKRKSKKTKFPLKSVVISGLILVLIGVTYVYYSKDDKVIKREHVIKSIPPGFPSFGIDVSHHQGEIDWNSLLKKEHYDTIIQFVYCKATEGSDHVDTKWERNRSILQQLDIPNGAYHFFSPKSEPRPQAKHFLNYWKKSDLDLPPVLDVESEGFSDEDLRAKMKIWLEEVEKQTGMRPVIYTSLNFFETKFMDHFKDYKFWIAAYSRKPEFIDDSRIIHWQYSETGELPGIDEHVDFNVSKISYR
jgi:lysozyme